MIDRQAAEEFTQGIGQIAGGTYKLVSSAVKFGVPKALELTTEEWVKNHLGGYVQLSIEERREAVKELLEDGHSQREVADIIGVTPMTVSRDVNGVTNVTNRDREQDKREEVVTNVTPNSEPLDVEILTEETTEIVAPDEDEPEPEPVQPLQPAAAGWHQLGPHWLYCGDSTDPEFIERCAGAALAFADPPYNAGKADWDNNFVWNHDYLADQAGIVAVTPGVASLSDFLTKTGMPYKWMMSAEITNGMTRGALGFGNWVAIPLFTNGSLYRNSKDILRIPASTGDDKGGIHPSRKPIRIITELLGLFTNKDDLVVDPFLGSGTTLIAADRLGRRCVGAEIDPMYCAHIIARYEQSR